MIALEISRVKLALAEKLALWRKITDKLERSYLRRLEEASGGRGQYGLRTMSITIHIPAALRAYCEGAREISLSAPSVRAVLEQIEQRHHSLYRSICDETGRVRRHVNLFVNTSHVRDLEGLDTALIPGDVLTILPAVSGG